MKRFETTSELYTALVSQKTTNGFFNWCCDCILFYANKLGCTYEELNIILFVILEPLIILILTALLIFKCKKR
jgi:cytochrome c oxidase subunit IV